MALADRPEPVSLSLPATPESVAVARRATSRYAADIGADAEAVAVAVSETVTNAVMHAYRNIEQGTVEVRTDRNGDHMVVIVSDEGNGMGPNPDSPGLGFGLAMISSLADEVGIESGEERGTRLRLRFRLG